MHCITQLAMRMLLWIAWLHQILPQVYCLPVSVNSPATNDTLFSSAKIDFHYVLAPVFIIAMVSTILGCLCCRRQRAGFQDAEGKKQQEFKDGSTAATETIIERDLELEVSRPSLTQLQFEPLTVECFVPEKNSPGTPKPPSSSLVNDRSQDNIQNCPSPCKEWFSPVLHVPRERLKYVQEIGRGWFGKVVEGTQTQINFDNELPKTSGVVVRILTEEASTSERAWFLGEALPYLKLHHPNILKLIGVCLETDPYLLLFESCPAGDLKAFLQANRSCKDTLCRENIPTKVAIDIAMGLDHMHRHGFSHTDLSARNCLVAADLSAKLGDYGIGVEKYSSEYYVVGDRALPIRWSAPESLVCTDTTIETRAITPEANLWSFAILLWEILSWGERPYNDLGDDQVIDMILSRSFYDYLPLKKILNPPENILDAIKSCWKLEPGDRARLPDIIDTLKGGKSDFDQRWETFRPNIQEPMRSMSLKELREAADSDLWNNDEKMFSTPQAKFKLGPGEPLRSTVMTKTEFPLESGSETEEESWRGRVERGAYTEKVKQKSKSVADLMVLVHIDSDSEAEWSLGPQAVDKPKKRMSSGSVGDLSTTVLTDEFDEALKKWRNPMDAVKIVKEVSEKVEESLQQKSYTSTPKQNYTGSSGSFVDVELWKNALEFELERKISGFDLESINFEKLIDSAKCGSSSSMQDLLVASSAPDTPQSRGEDLSVDNDDFSNSEEVETERRRIPDVDEEEDRKHLSTPDDERSSDSGFRDKESCEEEENPQCVLSLSGPLPYGVFPLTNLPLSASVEEEQLKVLLELDNILDAEDCGSLEETLNLSLSPSKINLEILDDDFNDQELSSQKTSEVNDEEYMEENEKIGDRITSDEVSDVNSVEEKGEESSRNDLDFEKLDNEASEAKYDDNAGDNDEDSSTMSLRSDNSYVSFNLDEEFVAAIRNELREKLPHAQMSVVESQELRDEDESTMNALEQETKTWDDDEESQDQDCSNIDIAIRYNIYGTPLSPILEERESNLNSDSLGDTSVASKLSNFSEDVLVVDTRTNQVVLVEGTTEHVDDDRDTTNGDITEDDSLGLEVVNNANKFLEKQGKVLGAPMPSPEEESKWQAQFPIPLQLQDDLMSTRFDTQHEWDSQDEDDDGADEDAAEEEDEDSSSSGEFIWKRYDDKVIKKDEPQLANSVEDIHKKSAKDGSKNEIEEEEQEEEDEDDDDEVEDDIDEEEFTPSAWDASLAPHRSALRSPEKTLKTGDQKKNVWFKKQRYHCVYEYPKETPVMDCQAQAITTWEPTSYSDWEEMMEKPRADIYAIDYEESNHNDEEFFVSSGNRPFQFQVGDGKYVSQFFPGASDSPNTSNTSEFEKSSNKAPEVVKENVKTESLENNNQSGQPTQQQLGELRHTRNRLKLDLPTKSNSNQSSTVNNLIIDKLNEQEDSQQINDENESKMDEKTETSTDSSTTKDDQSIISIIRSPIESFIENLSRSDLNNLGNGESDSEISELETSFIDEEIVKSSQRPLLLMKMPEPSEQIDHDTREMNEMPNSLKAEVDEKSTTATERKNEGGMSDTNVKCPSTEDKNSDGIISASDEPDCVIKSCETDDDEQLNKSVREPT